MELHSVGSVWIHSRVQIKITIFISRLLSTALKCINLIINKDEK